MPSSDNGDGRLLQVTVDPRLKARGRRWLWIIGIVAFAVWLAVLVREIWLPLAIAFIIAMVLDPVVDRMEKRGWPRLWATLLIFVSFFVTSGVAFYFALPSVVGQAQEISAQVSQYIPTPGSEDHARKSVTRMLDRAHAPAYVRDAVQRSVTQLGLTLSRSTTWLSEHAMEVLSNLLWLVIIPIVTFYALKDFHLIFGKALLLVPRERRDFVQTMVAEVTTIFAKYLRGLALVSVFNGLATWVLLVALRMPNAFTLGAIAGALYSIPYLGALMTIMLIGGVAFIAGHGIGYVALVLALNILLHQFIFDQIITPRILGGHVGLHPILSIIALLAGNVLLGILGMLLAVPVAACIQMLVLALVPKLRHEIDVTGNIHEVPDTAASLAQDTKDQQVQTDATEELHRSVSQAVDAIEAKADQPTPTDETVLE